jgi:ubiquinone/menaquinone biosynthesis C-methylase UbiE
MTKLDDNDEVAAAYDDWAAVYDSMENRTRDLDAAVLRRQALNLGGTDVLEVGSGTGKNTVWLAARARSVVGLDFSEHMLARARARTLPAHVRFVRHDLRAAWPLPDAAVDVVVADLVLEHVEHLQHFFSEARRVLRSRGQLFNCELHPFRQLIGGQAEFTAPGSSTPRKVTAHLHDVSEYVNAGLGAGFRLVRLDEWRDQHSPATKVARLLSLLWQKPE